MVDLPVRESKKNNEKTISRANSSTPDPFIFVPITSGEAAKGRGSTKPIVRAHVTRVQHAKSRNLRGLQDIQSWTAYASSSRESSLDRSKAPRRSRPKRKPKAIDSETSEESSRHGDSQEQEAVSSETAIVPSPRGSARADPFWTYPVDHQPELAPIFAHYIENVAVEIPDIDGPEDRGVLRKYWFPLAMTDAATMYAVLLMAASHYCILNPSEAGRLNLLALKARALKEINAAIATGDRAKSDAMIGAVGKMAAYEAVFGDSDVFAAHMRGLQMMLNMRGGLSTLGCNGVLERLLVWIDLNAAHLLGTTKALGGDDFPTTVTFAAPDPYHFAGIS